MIPTYRYRLNVQKSKLESNTIETLITETKSIEQIRKSGITSEMLESIAREKAEMDRRSEEAKSRLPGNFIKFASDREKKTLWFTGEHQIVEKAAVDWTTKQEIPGRMTKRWRWQVYDISDINNPSEAAIWERGYKESSQIMHFLAEKNQELIVVRNGRPNSKDTTYLIYPAGR
jgi:hypothetical protein